MPNDNLICNQSVCISFNIFFYSFFISLNVHVMPHVHRDLKIGTEQKKVVLRNLKMKQFKIHLLYSFNVY